MVLEIPAGGPTKEEIVAISVAKLRLFPGARVIEVGCGSGAVTAALARAAREVTAIDRREEAVLATQQRLSCEGIGNVSCICGDAVSLLPAISSADAAFIGGSRDLRQVLEIIAGKVRGRIVVNAVQLSTLHATVRVMQDLGIFLEAVSVQVARTVPIGDDMMFSPYNPVFIVVGNGDSNGGKRC